MRKPPVFTVIWHAAFNTVSRVLLADERFADAAEHRVDAVQLADARLGLAALGHVLHRADRLDHAAVDVTVNRAARMHHPDAAVGPHHAVVGAIVTRARMQGAREFGDPPGAAVVRMHHVHHALVFQRHAAGDGQQLVHLIGPDERAVRQVAPAADPGVALCLPEPLFVFSRRGFARLPRGGVLHHATHADRDAALAESNSPRPSTQCTDASGHTTRNSRSKGSRVAAQRSISAFTESRSSRCTRSANAA
jgi:hypothetical protein